MPDFATLIARPSPAPGAPEPTAGRWLAGVRRGLDLLVAFATLRDAESADDERASRGQDPIAPSVPRYRPPAPVEPTRPLREAHSHRRPRRAGPRGRRPGAVAPPPHACRPPLAAARPARRAHRAVGTRS